jgi:hypothetical protein
MYIYTISRFVFDLFHRLLPAYSEQHPRQLKYRLIKPNFKIELLLSHFNNLALSFKTTCIYLPIREKSWLMLRYLQMGPLGNHGPQLANFVPHGSAVM